MNSHCAILIHSAFIMCVATSVQMHCIHELKCSNFRMLEYNVEMFESFNALKLAGYWCVLFCFFFSSCFGIVCS